MKSLDALAGEFERGERVAPAGGARPRDLVRRHPHAGGVEGDPIEFLRVIDERRVAARGNVGDDPAHHRLDVGRSLALGVEEGPELAGKIGGAGIEANSHKRCSARL